MIFLLDRDGVINVDSPGQYVCTPEQWQPIPGSVEAIARLCSLGYQPVVVSNQSGLARGLFTLADLEAIHRKMLQVVEAAGGSIHGIFYCPHLASDKCECRKPGRGMLDAIESEMGQTVQGAALVGDKLSDLLLAVENNCKPILVRTGHGRLTEQALLDGSAGIDIPGLQVFDDLAHAVGSG
jgi:D-glycero-D-manno-heptose 1,7-bisphosphate phosphatase